MRAIERLNAAATCVSACACLSFLKIPKPTLMSFRSAVPEPSLAVSNGVNQHKHHLRIAPETSTTVPFAWCNDGIHCFEDGKIHLGISNIISITADYDMHPDAYSVLLSFSKNHSQLFVYVRFSV
jgi:hypothetical protein